MTAKRIDMTGDSLLVAGSDAQVQLTRPGNLDDDQPRSIASAGGQSGDRRFDGLGKRGGSGRQPYLWHRYYVIGKSGRHHD
ncbi:MAG: hypothetical protein ACR5LG_01050 [Sodalis sp. (in: enterobacteria)]|uniref:hypothetical protein n=1 Tax=Sodalis sp. (in: enterobacteria) TaxID=1898979 RepID=UPI003F34BB2C